MESIIEKALGSYQQVIVPALTFSLAILALRFAATFLRRPARPPRPRAGRLARLLYLAVMLAIAVLATTAFYAISTGGALDRYLLLVHTMAGATLVVLLALLALLCSRANRFGASAAPLELRPPLLTRLAFWSLLICGLASAASMLLATVPLFDTAGLEQLLDLHRWAGLCLVMTAIAGTEPRQKSTDSRR